MAGGDHSRNENKLLPGFSAVFRKLESYTEQIREAISTARSYDWYAYTARGIYRGTRYRVYDKRAMQH